MIFNISATSPSSGTMVTSHSTHDSLPCLFYILSNFLLFPFCEKQILLLRNTSTSDSRQLTIKQLQAGNFTLHRFVTELLCNADDKVHIRVTLWKPLLKEQLPPLPPPPHPSLFVTFLLFDDMKSNIGWKKILLCKRCIVSEQNFKRT